MTNAIKPHIKLPNGDVLFEGDYAKRRDGKVVGPLECQDNGWWRAGVYTYNKYGCWCSTFSVSPDLFAKADPPQVKETPKLWRDMTDAEKGALLLAEHEGHEVQKLDATADGMAWSRKSRKKKYDPCLAYRKKPEPAEPKRETVVLYGGNVGYGWVFSDWDGEALMRITFTLIKGKMTTGTFTNENGETIVVEEME